MFFDPDMMSQTYYAQRENEASYIRILHAVPNAPAVDVYANGRLIANNLRYRNFTNYLNVQPGAYNIEIFPAGRRDTPVLRTTATLPPRSIFTLAAIGLLPSIMLLPINEPKLPIPPGMSLLRFSHLSPNAPNVDVARENGQILFRDVSYKETTNYINVRPGNYRLQLRVTGTNQVALDVPNIVLMPNRIYTIYAVGLVAGQPPLQVLIPLDGSTYLNP